jgi:regulatory protein
MRGSRPRKLQDEAALYDYAIRALGSRMHSVAELKRLMRRRADGDDAAANIERVVARLKEQNYLNDSTFASSFTRYRKENEKFGKRRVVNELRSRGVHSEVIADAVTASYDDNDEEQLARAYLHRKRLTKPTDQKQSARIFRRLMQAGFSSRTIVRILNKWDVDVETITALEEEEPE